MELTQFVYWSCHSIIKATYQTLVSGNTVGLPNIPKKGACILASNHASHVDPPFVGCQTNRQLTFFARKTLWKPGIASWWLDAVGTIPVDRDGDSDISAMKRTLRTLKEKGMLTLFPEGTRSPNGQLQRAKPGIGLIAAKSQAAVVPCRIFDSHKVLSKDSIIPNVSVRIHIAYGKPMLPSEYDPGKSAGKDRYQIVADRIMKRISEIETPRIPII